MEEFRVLIMLLKVAYQDVSTMHRYLVGDGWFEAHEVLEGYYKHIAKDIDELCEIGLAINIEEPSIEEAILKSVPYDIEKRTAYVTYELVQGIFNDIVAQINRIGDIPEDVINLLQEKQTWYRKEADFKLRSATDEG